jgi:hypothetical protein
VNPWAGEVALVLGGERRRMKLTLGTLAELEAEIAAEGLIPLVERFEDGRFSARDVAALLAAGLRGGGGSERTEDLLVAEIEGGPMAGARAGAELLARAFALPLSVP